MTVALLIALVLFANTVQAMTGFGSTVIALTLGAWLMPIRELKLLLIALNVPLSAFIVVRNWGVLDKRLLFTRVLPIMAPSFVLGVVAKDFVGDAWLTRAYGVFVTGGAIRELWLAKQNVKQQRPSTLALFGWLSLGGVTQGAYGSGGPPVVAALSRLGLPKASLRATLMGLWLTTNALLLTHSFAQRAWTWSLGAKLLPLVGCVPAGLFLGERLHRAVDERVFFLLVQGVLVVAGLALVAR